jgi:chloride channel 2
MNGRYTQSLGEYAKEQAAKIREQEQKRKREEKQRIKELRTPRGKWATRFLSVASFIWRHTFAKIGEDWVFLAILGIIMAVISFVMDYGIKFCNTGKLPIAFTSTHF